MKTLLLRTGSVPLHTPVFPGSPKVSLSVHDSVSGLFSREKNTVASPKISLPLDVNRRKKGVKSIPRALSESDMIGSAKEVSVEFSTLSGVGSRSFPARIPEEEYLSEGDVDEGGPLSFKRNGYDQVNYGGIWPESGIPIEELRFFGGGFGKDKKSGGGGGESGDDIVTGEEDRSKIDAYYQEMLKSNPGNSLLLRNYGKFLHEVEKDTVRAEEYYGRAILASPGDGEVLSLYGQLIWETERDENRAKSYFDQAVYASPDDWYFQFHLFTTFSFLLFAFFWREIYFPLSVQHKIFVLFGC
ncbi:hypothetical protein L1049_023169 [Liquidambar formosana]|uniref:TmcB/TmcC TPR repeats domain-containing protein n=1 Tax=Liquidambar formosana TaxID=63359 RepID=A0AAP0RDR5_LIQFO